MYVYNMSILYCLSEFDNDLASQWNSGIMVIGLGEKQSSNGRTFQVHYADSVRFMKTYCNAH